LGEGQKSQGATRHARGEGRLGAAQKVKVVREVVIVALAGFLIGIIVAAVLVHFLS
jgi:hypothetical protein